jgi:hypothetical protein
LKENQQLTQLRDLLLPMLMNGQVSVSDQAPPMIPVSTKSLSAEEKIDGLLNLTS